MISVEDTLYFVSGRVCPKGECCTVVKMDIQGNILAQRLFDWIDPGDRNVIIKDGNRILVAGHGGYYTDTRYELLVLSADDLDSLDHRSYGVPDPDIIALANRSLVAYKEHYVILGFTHFQSAPHPSKMFWINKKNLSLDTIITLQLGTSWTSLNYGFVGPDSLLTVSYRHNVGVLAGRGFLKFNADKEIVWQWAGQTDHESRWESALLLSNGNMVIEQWVDYKDDNFSLLCINPQGEQVWLFEVPFEPFGLDARFICNLSEAANGDILGSGSIYYHFPQHLPWPIPWDEIQMFTAAYTFRLSPQGEMLWEHAVLHYHEEQGIIAGLYLLNIHELSDGSLIMSGRIHDHLDDTGQNYLSDSWVIRTDAAGCLIPGCGFYVFNDPKWVSVDERHVTVQGQVFNLLGNPVRDVLRVQFSGEVPSGKLEWTIWTVEGRPLARTAATADRIQEFPLPGGLPAGYYLLSLRDAEGRILQTERFLKL